MKNIDFNVQKLRLEPGDIAVLTTNEKFSIEQVRQIGAEFKKQVGGDNKILILTSGLQLTVLTRAQIEAMAI